MKTFVKLNILAFLYAFILFIQTELMGNVLRLERITHWFNRSNILILIIVIFIISTVLFVFLTRICFNTKKLKYLLTVFWIPYYIVLVFLFSFIAPISKQDEPSNAFGLILLSTLFCFPLYIAFINAVCEIPPRSHFTFHKAN